jgi:hypothetical protein
VTCRDRKTPMTATEHCAWGDVQAHPPMAREPGTPAVQFDGGAEGGGVESPRFPLPGPRFHHGNDPATDPHVETSRPVDPVVQFPLEGLGPLVVGFADLGAGRPGEGEREVIGASPETSAAE